MKYIYLFISIFLLASCVTQQVSTSKTRKPIVLKKNNTHTKTSTTSKTPTKTYNEIIEASGDAKEVLKEAKKYIGTQYKLGGTTKDGMDCSGLTSVAFKAVDVTLERRSIDQAKQGVEVQQKEAKPGDLIFFNTSGSGISHTGIIESIKDNEIFFIHASISKGVMISSLEEKYWKPKLVIIKRIIE